MSEIVRVGMAELKTAKAPDKIVTLGLGSCVGVCAYDAVSKIGGMVHIMLPDSSLALEVTNPAKFADTGVPLLLQELKQQGVIIIENIIIKIVGGAEMFAASSKDVHLGVGARNILAVEETCQELNLMISAKSVGGNAGKSITLNLDTGIVEVKSMNTVSAL
jgi:chemotaxis protein CheD